MTIVKILFVLLLIIFPLGQIGRVELGGGVNILLNDVAVFLVVASWIFEKLRLHTSFQKRELAIPIFLFVAAAIVSLVVNMWRFPLSQIGIASLYLLRFVTYVGLYFVVNDFSVRFQKKVILGLLAAGTTTALLGFIQYFFYPDLRNLYYAGWDEHLYRLFSTFLDPNFAGGIFVLTFLLAFSMFFSLKRRDLSRLIFSIVLLGLFIGILLTYSRGSFISFVVGTTVFLLMAGRMKLIRLLLITFVVGVFFLPKDLQSEGVKLFRTASIESRMEEAQTAIAIFRENPVFGVGFNAYRYAKARMGFAATNEFGDIHSAAGTGNSFLLVLATTGMVGFMAYLYLLLSVIKGIKGNPLILSSFIAIFVHALFVNSLFYPHIMEWLWILLGIFTVDRKL